MIGQYFIEQREALGVSQVELATGLGFSAQFMGRIEKGDVGIPEDALVKAVAILNLDPSRIRKIYMYSVTNYIEDIFKSAKKVQRNRVKKTNL